MPIETCAELSEFPASRPKRRDYDPEEVDKLVLQYLPLVKSIARRVFTSLPPHAAVEVTDLAQAGYIGLVNASRSYKADTKVPFATYARYRIRGEILDSLRKLDCASRNLRQWQKQMELKSRDLSASLQRDPTDEEIGEGLGIEIAQVREKKLKLRFAGACSGAMAGGDDPDKYWQEQPSAPDTRPDTMRAREEMKQVLALAIHSLPNRSREVIVLYYSNEMTMKQIGEVLNVNESRISQIHKCALRIMARTLRLSGISSSTDV
ncbi:MAG: FliA/WhiG family RNA polymerase sigma factor [Acidobacteriota bacterium]|nr:FliA/WhiG family RNA polymerase sigma factor [Acidobacteriota bacterium]